MQTKNLEHLQYWVSQHSKEELAFKTGIGFHTIGRILRGERVPSKTQRIAIREATGLPEKDLPLALDNKRKIA